MTDRGFEKTGNANWVQCPECAYWFHVSADLLEMANVPLVCPECAHSFLPDHAREIVRSA